MRIYTLDAVIDHEFVDFKKQFGSRTEAINYMFQYYEDHALYSLQVRDEYPVNDNKHCIEYVCNFHNRFIVARN